MSSPKPPDFIMGTSLQITTSWGSYYQGSHEQLMGISRATFLRCRKTQQVREYNQRRAIETSWERLLHPVTWGRVQKEEERDTAVRFADTVEDIAQMKTQTPVELEEQQQQPRRQCMSELEKPEVDGEETGKGAVEDEAMSLAVADEEVLVETVNKA
ncbi:hypothetical protein LX36DRAFT_671626 [Colletotrichum falcatum]|nr:hypothetical protein LX36DRAFT_671626 [Colletotrichum falcatum]